MNTTQILERTRMCQTSGTRRVTNFTNSVKSREGEKKNKIVTMTNLKHPLSSVTQIFRNGQTIIPTVKLQLNHYEPYEQLCLP